MNERVDAHEETGYSRYPDEIERARAAAEVGLGPDSTWPQIAKANLAKHHTEPPSPAAEPAPRPDDQPHIPVQNQDIERETTP